MPIQCQVDDEMNILGPQFIEIRNTINVGKDLRKILLVYLLVHNKAIIGSTCTCSMRDQASRVAKHPRATT